MEIQHVLFILDGVNSRSAKMTLSKDRLKQPISPFFELGFEKFFDSDM